MGKKLLREKIMNADEYSEKRIFKRINENIDVRIKIEDNDLYNIKKRESLNISASGILINHDKSIKIGKIIHVSFLQPNSFEILQGNARVIRSEFNHELGTYDIGIEFHNLTNDEKKKLNYFLTYIK